MAAAIPQVFECCGRRFPVESSRTLFCGQVVCRSGSSALATRQNAQAFGTGCRRSIRFTRRSGSLTTCGAWLAIAERVRNPGFGCLTQLGSAEVRAMVQKHQTVLPKLANSQDQGGCVDDARPRRWPGRAGRRCKVDAACADECRRVRVRSAAIESGLTPRPRCKESLTLVTIIYAVGLAMTERRLVVKPSTSPPNSLRRFTDDGLRQAPEAPHGYN